MIMQIEGVLGPEDVARLTALVTAADASFQPGSATAGWHARQVKHNEQAAGSLARDVTEAAEKALLDNPVFRAAARPKRLVGLLLSRYRPGMEYGLHVDDALMQGTRTDLSFTLFLSPPETYDGGELVIEGNDGSSDIKLPAGAAVLYPSTTLHRVAPVTRGERLVVVGWVRSFVRSAERREILFDLDQSVAELKALDADRAVLGRILKTRANLLRMWAED